jgi:hypothetical protein
VSVESFTQMAFELGTVSLGVRFGVWSFFFIGFVMLLAAIGDIGMMVRGGLSGAKRLVRHLWRM